MSDDDGSPLLLQYLARSRRGVSAMCGYNVRGLATPRCPECGRPIKLTVGIAEPYQSAWVGADDRAGGGSAGIGVLAYVGLFKGGWPDLSDGPVYMRLEQIAFVYQMLMPPCVIAALVGRRFLKRLRRTTQWWLFAQRCCCRQPI